VGSWPDGGELARRWGTGQTVGHIYNANRGENFLGGPRRVGSPQVGMGGPRRVGLTAPENLIIKDATKRNDGTKRMSSFDKDYMVAIDRASANAKQSGESWVVFINSMSRYSVERVSGFSDSAEVLRRGTFCHPDGRVETK